jgi:hypothetical protein
MSTASIVSPSCGRSLQVVRARTMQYAAACAYDDHVFCPFRTNAPPERAACVRSEARSLPASGSLKPWHQISLASRIRGR